MLTQVTAGEFFTDATHWLVGKPLRVLAMFVIALVVRWFTHRAIDRFVRSAEDGILPQRLSKISVRGVSLGDALSLDDPGTTRRVQRAQTLGSLLKSIASGVIFAILFVTILAEVGVNIAPILASAGILGVALGFGAQSLVKDFLAGIFMIFEDQFGVGDSIDLATVSGTVEAVTLRVTRLRDVNGTVWYIRNGEILRVGNQSQNWARTVLDIPVVPSTDLVKVRAVLQEVAHDLWLDEDFTGVVLEEPEVWGVQELTSEAMTVRLTLKTAPLSQWRVAREMRERVKARFEHEGIALAPAPAP
ncbi:mechanosensitive ion channel family protein [Nocardioides bigeumensis]|uniref:Mechanosensitive ion channel n=1 Tax=Nocardioides bigeumensis TaxID=433657 RepID=A0ABN2XPD2_9ACTN